MDVTPVQSRRPRILLGDDYESLLLALQRLLEPRCEVVGRTTTTAQLVEAARARRPDVAIVDLFLPEAGGIEACRQLKSVLPDIKIIILTAADDSLQEASLAAGASAFVQKRVLDEELWPAIERAISPDLTAGSAA